MASERSMKKDAAERGITKRFDRRHVFKLTRIQDPFGFKTYVLENLARSERVLVGSDLFDRFRGAIGRTLWMVQKGEIREDFQLDLFFRTEPRFTLSLDRNEAETVALREHSPMRGSTGFMSIHFQALPALHELLHDPDLKHANELLDRIITYHKLFQFSFEEKTDSITSDWILRNDVLCHIERYFPTLGTKKNPKAVSTGSIRKLLLAPSDVGPARPAEAAKQFKSRLAERDREGEYQVDYDVLFNKGVEAAPEKSRKKIPEQPEKDGRKETAKSGAFALPILASNVKAFASLTLRCEFGKDDMQLLRRDVLAARESDFYIGFEIVDCVYKRGAKLQTFKFPLYYLPVTLEESGRGLLVHQNGDRLFLNHLALANAVQSFAETAAGHDMLAEFFQSLLAQHVELEQRRGRVVVMRHLPIHEDVYKRTREILLGFAGEHGKGGLLGHLKLQAIECDLDSVNLYRSPKPSLPTAWALERDLDMLLEMANKEPRRFQTSLLGSLLSPDAQSGEDEPREQSGAKWCPGAQPKSMRHLLQHLDKHDLVLLEGPPGTGKTFTIVNLLIHCVCNGQRVLVVSDRASALYAITERLQAYLLGKDRESTNAKRLEALWRAAIKVIDEVPADRATLTQWVQRLRIQLRVDSIRELDWPEPDRRAVSVLKAVDERMDALLAALDQRLRDALGPEAKSEARVSPKVCHPKTDLERAQLFAFIGKLKATRGKGDFGKLIGDFIRDRDWLCRQGMHACLPFFALPEHPPEEPNPRLAQTAKFLAKVLEERPLQADELAQWLGDLEANEITTFVAEQTRSAFKSASPLRKKVVRKFKGLFAYPLKASLAALSRMLRHQERLLAVGKQLEPELWSQLVVMHNAFLSRPEDGIPLVLELARFFTRPDLDAVEEYRSIQEELLALEALQEERDEIVRRQFVGQLGQIGKLAFEPVGRSGTNRLTSILATLDSLEAFPSLATGWPVLRELQKVLYDTYPVWLCQKRAVPFLLPFEAQSFDFIIVDEATQCRVDDALPLLLRAKKLMAVGDEKQTVLDKESALDDYLFADFDLDEHLRGAQAQAMKGGGSHLFGLVKRIKQASVMLDEHYRCTPDIIEFSNRYVYDNDLRVMQWVKPNSKASVVVDHSELDAPPSSRKAAGKWKGIDTDMVDRFLEFVVRSIREIEQEIGARLNLETDVALCYFLLKNEAYIKNVKGDFLSRLKRGSDVLDGAGAALQGKERDYIFYLWDITRSNFAAFRHGDDPNRRKGELNVLMSRPKKRAYHFLHRDFATLPHHSATITDYLWRKRREQERPTSAEVGQAPPPINLSNQPSGLLFKELLALEFSELPEVQIGVTVGDPAYVVDLMFLPKGAEGRSAPSVALVDVSGFEDCKNPAEEVIDYYFQLQRAIPSVLPVFAMAHELVDKQRGVIKLLKKILK